MHIKGYMVRMWRGTFAKGLLSYLPIRLGSERLLRPSPTVTCDCKNVKQWIPNLEAFPKLPPGKIDKRVIGLIDILMFPWEIYLDHQVLQKVLLCFALNDKKKTL